MQDKNNPITKEFTPMGVAVICGGIIVAAVVIISIIALIMVMK